MTANQIAYQRLIEDQRSNRARESETERSNRARENQAHLDYLENSRHNQSTELENNRANLVREGETSLSNRNREQEDRRSNQAREAENYRANVAREENLAAQLKELNRHQKETEAIQQSANNIKLIDVNAQSSDRQRAQNTQVANSVRDSITKLEVAKQQGRNTVANQLMNQANNVVNMGLKSTVDLFTKLLK